MVTSEQTLTSKQLETLCINTIRTLAMDAVQQANSGHPGAPMALAPVTYCLWQNFLRYGGQQRGNGYRCELAGSALQPSRL